MPNPKGTVKNLKPVTTNRDKPLTSKVSICVDKDTLAELNALPNKAEFCRNAILKALDELKKDIIPDTLK